MRNYLFSYLLIPFFLPYILGVNKAITPQKNTQIVLIFDKNPTAIEAKKGMFYTNNNVRYYGNDLVRNDIELHNKTKVDTVRINTARETLPIDLFHNYIIFSYHFKQGDTVVFTFKDDVPFVAKINRSTKPFDLNYPLLSKKRFNEKLANDNTYGSTNTCRTTIQ